MDVYFVIDVEVCVHRFSVQRSGLPFCWVHRIRVHHCPTGGRRGSGLSLFVEPLNPEPLNRERLHVEMNFRIQKWGLKLYQQVSTCLVVLRQVIT